jgi:Lar family restriction alleviation protein
MSGDLKPCPFCGEKYVTTEFDRGQGDKWGYASCDVCAACGPEVRTNYDREPDGPWHSEAIAAWNTRADADRIEQLNERLTAATDDAKEAEAYAEQLEAKLTKAVEALRKLDRRNDSLDTFDNAVHEIVSTALAELEGGE